MPPASRPWRGGLAAGVGAAAIVWILVSLIDAGAAGFGALPVLAGLWAPPALAVGIAVGVVIAGFRATFGERSLHAALRRLRDDRKLDIALTGAVLAAAVIALVLIGVVGVAAKGLVANVERKATGARLLGVVVVALVPLLALAGVPIFRVTRQVARLVPRLGPIPGVVVIALAGVIAVGGLGMLVIFTQLDWQVLGVGFYGLLLLLGFGTVLLHLAANGPLGALRERIPARGWVALGAAAVLALVPLVTLGKPSRETKTAVLDHSLAGSKWVAYYSKISFLFDKDGDGYSTFFDGPDCDDSNPDVHPGAVEIPGDGIDNDCRNGDRAKTAEPVGTGPGTGTGTGTGSAAPVPGQKPLADGDNLIILMVDTVRGDRLGVAGYQRDGKSITPNLDQLAAGGTYFSKVYSVSSNTPRCMPAFMTSRWPSTIAVDDLHSNYPILDESNTMLFEVLHAAGFATFGFSSHYYFTEKRHFAQGFDNYNNDGWLEVGPANHDISAPRIVPRVIDKLNELGTSKQRFAIWVHLFDPHSTYMEHDDVLGPDGKPRWPITEHGTAGLEQKYDYEIAFDDDWIGKILDTLKSTGLDKNTVVVMLADHGEAFGVHRFAGEQMFFHGQTLYDELLRIPLIIKVPGVDAKKVPSMVQLIDVAPTLCEIFGIPVPPSFQGRSLAPALRGETLPPKPAYAELISYPNWQHDGRAIVSADGKWKLFDRTSDNLVELYDLENDPEERHDVFDQHPDVVKDLEDQLDDWNANVLHGGK